jgi:long-chain acyl-CoA synthetase
MSDMERPPWQRSFPDICDWDGRVETGIIPDLLAPAVAARPDACALEFREQRISYGSLNALVEQLAAGLMAKGIGKGDRVALLLPNTPWHPVAFFALARCGATVVHLSALDAPRELAHKIGLTKPCCLITTNLAGFLPAALDLLAAGKVAQIVVGEDKRWGDDGGAALSVPGMPGVSSLDALMTAQPPARWPEVSPDDTMLLQFTGGTTGLSKAAVLSHGNLVCAVNSYRLWGDGVALEPGAQKAVAVLPLFHIYALTTVLLRHLRDGNEIMLRQRFDVPTLLTDISKKRATLIAGVPTIWFALLNHPGAAEIDYSSLRVCVSGGAPMPNEIQTQLEQVLGLKIYNGWGMTETSPAGTRVPRSATRRPGLIGVPLPGVMLKIVALGDDRADLAPGETGEIAIRGANVFRGYYENPEATREAFIDGWFLTGDIGRMDADGLFEIVDRRKNMIISGGFNVYPVQVESAIYEHPAVREVIVIGIDDAYRGQSAKAFITLKDGAQAFTLEALQDFLKERLGRHEWPRALEFRDALPRSPAGKLLASVLVDEERQKAAAGMKPTRT